VAVSSPTFLPIRSNPAAPLRVAVVGAGVMGRRHARVLASRPDRFALTGIVDLDAAVAREVAEAHGAPMLAREVEAIAGAEAVIVATPTAAHALTVQCALACGRHVLVEKPVAARAQDASELVRLSNAGGARLFVGHSERFNPVVRALARLVEASEIRALELRRVGARSGSPAAATEGALVNLGVHDLDLASYLTRSPLSLASSVGELGAGGREERAQVLGRTGSGAALHILVDQRAGAVRRRTVVLLTARHAWHGDLLAPSLVRVCRTTGAREAIPLDTEEPLLAQALAFAAAVRGGATHEIATGFDGARALLAAERAARRLRDAARPAAATP
jgi:predicted dehydrogenase